MEASISRLETHSHCQRERGEGLQTEQTTGGPASTATELVQIWQVRWSVVK